MVFQPFLSRHITHFAECVNHLLNKLGNRTSYSPVSLALVDKQAPHVYLPLLHEEREFEWTKTYVSLLLSLFPETHRPKLHFSRKTETSPELECFKSVVLCSWRFSIGFGGSSGLQQRWRHFWRVFPTGSDARNYV